jgi:hypothetical protein|tara:strand:+ start:488 stop:727 length:240 start_codon:yes stop_codon:yes gene_type:complete
MLIIVIVCFLVLNAIFWGLIPVSRHSPHQQLLNFFEIDYKPNVFFHLIIGTLFYISAVVLIHKGDLLFENQPISNVSSE